MVRKKKGSSLITVVILSGILITVGTAILSMTVGDYKMRITESTRIKNLYSSESGLDGAYDILIKTFDAAAVYGVKEVESYKKTDTFIIDVAKDLKLQAATLKNDIISIRNSNADNKDTRIKAKNKQIDLLNEQIKIEEDKAIDSYFKMEFNDFVYMNEKLEDESKINSFANKDELRKCIKEKSYIKDIEKSKDSERYKEVIFNTENTIDLFVDTADQDNKGIKYDPIDVDLEKGIEYPTRKYTIKITANYITEDNIGKTERTLQSTYDMTVPNYKDVAFNESNVGLPKYTFLTDKALLIGGTMKVKDSSLTVDGNVFVEGTKHSDNGSIIEESTNNISTRAYDKYYGGIVLDSDSNSRNINFTGDVITGKTFNIRNNVNAIINGNLYARNVYAGSENATNIASKNSILEVKPKDNKGGEVVVDNDITLKADGTTITIDKFYGINDKNIKYDNTKPINTSNEPLGRTSSSIIVNGQTGSNIIINSEAYIMGVAHINTKDGYNTGESTGIKGNYIAYAVPSVDKDGNIDGNKYYEPLQLLKEDNVIKKSEHFVNYWKDKTIDTGGIKLPEGTIEVDGIKYPRTCSIGAIVYKGLDNKPKVVNSSYNLTGIPTVVRDKQKEFASKVYNIGGKTLSETEKQVLYESLGSDKDKVEDLMYIDETFDNYKKINKIFFTEYDGEVEETPDEKNNNEKAIFSNKNIKIRESSENNIAKDGDDIVINVPKDKILNAFIATSGDVTIEGKVKVEGNIIAKGNLEIKENYSIKETTVKYNKDLSNRIQASNVELFNSVFGHMREEPEVTRPDNPLKVTSPGNLKVEYDVNKFIKNTRWNIIK